MTSSEVMGDRSDSVTGCSSCRGCWAGSTTRAVDMWQPLAPAHRACITVEFQGAVPCRGWRVFRTQESQHLPRGERGCPVDGVEFGTLIASRELAGHAWPARIECSAMQVGATQATAPTRDDERPDDADAVADTDGEMGNAFGDEPADQFGCGHDGVRDYHDVGLPVAAQPCGPRGRIGSSDHRGESLPPG